MLNPKEEQRANVLNGVLDRRWTGKQGAELLKVSERHLWRMLAAYRGEGIVALVHGNRGKKPVHATPEEQKDEVVRLASGPYDGANYAHLADLLAERDGLRLSRWTVRRILKAAGLRGAQRRRRGKHRSRRERYPQEGMLFQVDGSRHQWLGAEGPWWTLVGGIDDATGTVPYAVFREQEDAQGYLLLIDGVAKVKGLPLALYSDRHSIFVHSSREPDTLEEQLAGRRASTQVGRALEELGIQWIAASSPQAKGRMERLWQTFQDRLVIELRLAGVKTIDEANRFLLTFLSKFNTLFAVPAQQKSSAYRPVPDGTDLAGILCMKYARVVGSDNTISFAGKAIQIQPTPQRASYARTHVEVQERLDGSTVIQHHGVTLSATAAPAGAVKLRARTGARASAGIPKQLGGRMIPVAGYSVPGIGENGDQGKGEAGQGPAAEARHVPVAKSNAHKPGPNHPWRTRALTKSLHP